MSRAFYFDNAAYTFRNIANPSWKPTGSAILRLTQRSPFIKSLCQTAQQSCNTSRVLTQVPEQESVMTPPARGGLQRTASVAKPIPSGMERPVSPAMLQRPLMSEPVEGSQSQDASKNPSMEVVMQELREIKGKLSTIGSEESKLAELQNKCFILSEAKKTPAAAEPGNPTRKDKEFERRLSALEKTLKSYVDEKMDEVMAALQKHSNECQEKTTDLHDLVKGKSKEAEAELKRLKETWEEQKTELRNSLEEGVKAANKQVDKSVQNFQLSVEGMQKKLESLRNDNTELGKTLEELHAAQDKLSDTFNAQIAEQIKKLKEEQTEKLAELETKRSELQQYANDIAGVAKGIEEKRKSAERDLRASLHDLKRQVSALCEGTYQSENVAPTDRNHTPISGPSNRRSLTTDEAIPVFQALTERKPASFGPKFSDPNYGLCSPTRDLREKVDYLERRFSAYRMTLGNEISCHAHELQSLRKHVDYLMDRADSTVVQKVPGDQTPTATLSRGFTRHRRQQTAAKSTNPKKVSVETGEVPTAADTIRSPLLSENGSMLAMLNSGPASPNHGGKLV